MPTQYNELVSEVLKRIDYLESEMVKRDNRIMTSNIFLASMLLLNAVTILVQTLR